MDGIRLSDAEPEVIRKLIPVGVELFLCQLLDIGAFHAGTLLSVVLFAVYNTFCHPL